MHLAIAPYTPFPPSPKKLISKMNGNNTHHIPFIIIQRPTMANKMTTDAGLTFNVNTIRHKMKEYYESQSITTPMYSGGHVAMAATLEKLYEFILKECVKKTGKDKSGMRQVNRELMHYSVMLHNGLQEYYVGKLAKFDRDQVYQDQVPIAKSEMDKVMERVDKDMTLTPKAFNLACYMLMKVFLDLSSTCNQMLTFAKKKTLDANCVMHAIKLKFQDGVTHELCGEISRAMKALGEEVADSTVVDNEDNAPADKGEVMVDQADTGDDEPAPKKGKAAEKKKPAQKAKPIEDDEDDVPDEADEEMTEVKGKKAPTPAKKTAAPKKIK